MWFSSVSSIERTLSGVPLPARVDQGAMPMKGYSAFPKAPALLGPQNHIV